MFNKIREEEGPTEQTKEELSKKQGENKSSISEVKIRETSFKEESEQRSQMLLRS